MFRLMVCPTALAATLILTFGPLVAQGAETWPDISPEALARGPGFYLSWMKILVCWLVFAAWVFTTDWVNVDCQKHHLNRLRWNPLVFGVFLAAVLLSWLLPWFWFNFLLLAAAFAIPLAFYISYRNGVVPPHEQVLTKDHFHFLKATLLNKLGKKVEVDRVEPIDRGPAGTLKACGAPTDRDNNVRLLTARQTPGFLAARELVARGMTVRAGTMMLDSQAQSMALKCQIDGVWIDNDPMPREQADPALESLKTLCGLNPADRANRQEGQFAVDWEGTSYTASLTSQGVAGGERVVIQFQGRKVSFSTLEELGMRPETREQLMQALAASHGLVIFSAMPAAGMRTTMNVALNATDRLTRDFLALEEESRRYEEVENIPVTTYQAAGGSSEVLATLFRQEPDAVVVRDLLDAELVRELCARAGEKLIISSIRAKDAAEALARVLVLKVPPPELARAVTLVLNQRLVRKLCPQCKEAYQPTPQVLQQLNLPPNSTQKFYRPPQKPEKPCRACGGIGYHGRTAIFQLLAVDAQVRSAIQTAPKLERIRQAAKKAGMADLQAEGLLLVTQGVTSLPELARVLAS